MNGVLCFEEYNGLSLQLLEIANVICCPGICVFFQMLLKVFHIGIWSCMPPSRLDLILVHLLPVELRLQLLFVYGHDKCIKRKPYPFFQKVPSRLTLDTKIHQCCKLSNVLMVDDCKWKNVLNGNNSCYFLILWKGEMQLPNLQNFISNVCIALLSLTMDLVHYDSVAKFLQNTPMDEKFHRL